MKRRKRGTGNSKQERIRNRFAEMLNRFLNKLEMTTEGGRG
jgi:hypothetical protein